MRYQPSVTTHNPKERIKYQRNPYSQSLSINNPQGTFHLLLKGDILTCYEQIYFWDLSAEKVCQHLQTDMHKGLNEDEAKQRLEKNQLPKQVRRLLMKRLLPIL